MSLPRKPYKIIAEMVKGGILLISRRGSERSIKAVAINDEQAVLVFREMLADFHK